ncbi:hypothetical protein HMPREF3185_00093 [Porphyromonas somerae]|uniref:Uncharacterized protein n=1 Tax=Porphyromonas somerae TaxID=322095 RepID=A0A134BFL0_9PORP|nr:hypothetical protein HMPREF3184_00093 [Porphyromonadaceae bacterium KA00676]KXB78680.1 hypothetical protein HMPREF3185_00093 [Porphyromonas somerae]
MCRGGGSEVCGFAKPCKCLLRAKIRTTAIKLPISAPDFSRREDRPSQGL